LTLNCGYGHGFSVLEVIDMVRCVSEVDLKVEHAGGREGDPAHIVAANERVRAALGWRPRFDDLSRIVRDALAWERQLMERFQRGDRRGRNLAEIA
jgi:UDP-glucose 4-epimerase